MRMYRNSKSSNKVRARKTIRWIKRLIKKKSRRMKSIGVDERSTRLLSREGYAFKRGRKGTLLID